MYCDHKSRSVRFFLGHQTCGGLGKTIACCVFKPRDLTQRARSQRRDADERGKELDRKIGAGKWDGTTQISDPAPIALECKRDALPALAGAYGWATSFSLGYPLLHVVLDLREDGRNVGSAEFGYDVISDCGRSRALDE